MDQGVAAAFKVHQLSSFAQAIAATKGDTEKTLVQFWKDHGYDCIGTLLGVTSPRSASTACWDACKRFVPNFKGFAKHEVVILKPAVAEMALYPGCGG